MNHLQVSLSQTLNRKTLGISSSCAEEDADVRSFTCIFVEVHCDCCVSCICYQDTQLSQETSLDQISYVPKSEICSLSDN